MDKKEEFGSYKDCQIWLQKGSNIETLAEKFANISGNDARRLSAKNWSESNSIWGRIAKDIFKENGSVQRFFLYTVWDTDRNEIKYFYDRINNSHARPAEANIQKGNTTIHCVCQRPYESGVDPSMVACDQCDQWYHMICINGFETFDVDKSYTCPFCSEGQQPPEEIKQNFSDAAMQSFAFINKKELDLSWDVSSIHKDTNLQDGSSSEPDDADGALPNCKSKESISSRASSDGSVSETDGSDRSIKKEKISDKSESSETSDAEEIKVIKKRNVRGIIDQTELEIVNTYLRKQPKEFQIEMERDTWNSVCDTNIQMLTLKGGSEPVQQTFRKMKIKHPNLQHAIAAIFNVANKFCVLTFYKRVLHQDAEIQLSSKQQLRVYATCLNTRCNARFVFTVHRIPIKGLIIFHVRNIGGELIHDEFGHSRLLSGNLRDNAKEQLANMLPFNFERAQMCKADLPTLQGGNRTEAKTLKVIQQARVEALKAKFGDMHADKIQDLISAALELRETINPDKEVKGYIQEISLIPFKLHLYTFNSLEVFHKLSRKQPQFELILDATAKILEGLPIPLNSSTPYLYTICTRSQEPLEAPISLFEFVSTKQTTATITHALFEYFERYKDLYNETRRFYGVRKIEIDFSKPLLASLIMVFQRCSSEEYFINLWRHANDPGRSLNRDEIFAIHVCRVHLQKCVRKNVEKHFKKTKDNKDVLELWSAWTRHFVRGKTIQHFYRRVNDAIIISASRYLTPAVEARVEKINVATADSGFKDDNAYNYQSREGKDRFYLKSPFGQYADKLLQEVEALNANEDDEQASGSANDAPPEKNPYYNKKFARYLTVHIMPYYPVISHMVFELFELPIVDDTTNMIECLHNILKHVVHADQIDKSPGRFCRSQCQYAEGGCKKVLARMPSRKGDVDAMLPQKSRESQRGSPEAFKEIFKKPQKKFTKYNSLMDLNFSKWGGLIEYNNKTIELRNTCSFDGILMILQALYTCSSIGKQFLLSMFREDGNGAIQTVVEEMSAGRVAAAKKTWICEVAGLQHLLDASAGKDSGQKADFCGDERDHLAYIAKWFKLIRIRKCGDRDCPAFRSSTHADLKCLDTDARLVTELFKPNVERFLESINKGVDLEFRDNECGICKGPAAKTSFEFLDGLPTVLFYALHLTQKRATRELDLPLKQNIQGSTYNVFAYTLYHLNYNPPHYTTMIVSGDQRVLYDGLTDGLISKAHKPLTDASVVSVWLLKDA